MEAVTFWGGLDGAKKIGLTFLEQERRERKAFIRTCFLSQEADGNTVWAHTNIGHGSNTACVGGERQEVHQVELVGGRRHLEGLPSADECHVDHIARY